MRHTWKLGHQRVSTVCVRSTPGTTCMSCAYKHGETVTHCMLSFSRLSCLPGKTARCLSLCLSLFTSLSPPLPSHCSMVFSQQNFLIHGDSLSVSTTPPPSRYHHGFFSVWFYNDRRAEPAASCLTGKSQAELANGRRRSSAAVGLQGCIIHSGFILISLPTL